MLLIKPRPYQKWDGSYKSLKEECPGCNWYKEIKGNKLCGFGRAFKYLSPPVLNRKCEEKQRSVEKHSLDYLIKAEKEGLFIDDKNKVKQLRLF